MTDFSDAPYGLVRIGRRADGALSRQQGRRLQQLGTLEPLYRGVSRVAASQRSVEQRAIGAAWAIGGVISHGTAARMHGLRSWTTFREVHLSIDVRRRASLADVAVHRRRGMTEADLVAHDSGALITAIPLTLLDIAMDATDLALRSAYHDAWHRELTSPVGVQAMLRRMAASGRNGLERFRQMLDRYDAAGRPVRSLNELRLYDAIYDAGLLVPRIDHPVDRASGEQYFIDLAWPQLRYGVEVDHTHTHGTAEQWQADIKRQAELNQLGWIIDRVMEDHVERDLVRVVEGVSARLIRLG